VKHQSIAVLSLVVLILIILACIFPGMITPYHPNAINFEEKFSPPSRAHPLGTDAFGRDLLARLLYGGRVTIGSSLVIAAGSTAIAVFWAAISAFMGGIWDELLTRIVDILMILPSLLFALLLVAILEPGMRSLILALTLVRWPGYARILRGDVIKLLGAEYLTAARALGAQPPFIIWHHIIPNMLPLIITLFGLSFASNILSISSLSFLGFGVQLPNPEWGAMINTARQHLQIHPYLMLFPGLAIIVTILLTNMSLKLLERD
jgi:ABC-type dipeptide/oligopeptide/nickel transport system permease subunit